MNWLLSLVLILVVVAIGIVGTVAGYPETWAAAGVLIVLLGVHALMDKAIERHRRRSGEGPGGDGILPAAHIEDDDDTPLGDTAEVHDELSPVDLPPGSHARRALRDQPERRSTG